nr:phage tail protein [uncultured Erwinia sp.]
MSTKFYTLLTDIGAAKLANASALGVPLKITQMAVGDGGGSLPTPSANQTALTGEKRRASLNSLSVDPQNSSQIIAEQIIPEAEGGWWIREVGLFDESGALIAVGNCPETYKPLLAEGSGRTQTVRMVLITSSTENITLKIDPSVVLATRKYVDDKVLELRVYVDEQLSKHLAAADPHKQYAPKASPIFTGVPKTPTAPPGNNTTQIATTEFVQNVGTSLSNTLKGKQPLDSTLTALAGKSSSAIVEYLGLKDAVDKSNGSLQKLQNGTDIPNKDLFVRNVGAARAYSAWIDTGAGNWTTAELIVWLESKGAFNYPYWMCKGSWSYTSNRIITDTGCGKIHLAGSVIEVMGVRNALTIRITTASASTDGCIRNAQFIYVNHGDVYHPGWRRDFNTKNMQRAFALGQTGSTVANDKAVEWDWDSGVYCASLKDSSAMVLHFNAEGGSCPAAQFKVNYKNGGLFYRSARDKYGFELDWSEVYTTARKPSAADIGAYTKGEIDSRYKEDFDAKLGIGNNGYQKLPSGLIIQYGYGSCGGVGMDSGVQNNFPKAFPSKCVSVVLSHVGHNPGSAGILSAYSVSNNGFKGMSSTATTQNTVTCSYIALGI